MTTTESKKPEWLRPEYPPLADASQEEAVKIQIIRYPMVVRKMDDPSIPNQMFANVSFMFFEEPKTLSTGKKVYGFCKVRGVWPTETDATQDSKRIIREVDSRFQIRIAPVGAWVPLTNENAFCRDLLDVETENGKTEGLRNDAIKEKEKQQRQVMRELKEREESVQDEDIYDDKSALKYYAMKRVTEMKLSEAVQINRKKLEKVEASQQIVRLELKHIECKFPEHSSTWLECYNEERAKSGIHPYVPGDTEFEEYEKVTLNDLQAESARKD